MKKLFAILLVAVLTSCGASLEPPKSNTDYKNIIGKPIKIGNLEVAQYDFPNVTNWDDGNKDCEALGKGWRLPTKDELITLYQNKNAIGNFGDYIYMGSKSSSDEASVRNFSNGRQKLERDQNGDLLCNVRAVRSL
jgi:hypothetical protein